MIRVQCPLCHGESFPDEQSRSFGICPYCGAKLRQEDGTDQKLRTRGRRLRLGAYILAAVLFLSGLLLSLLDWGSYPGILLTECSILPAFFSYLHFLGEPRRLEQARCRRQGMVRLPFAAVELRRKDPAHMRKLYTRLGFTNISVLPIREPGKKPGLMAAITIGGAPPRVGQWYDPKAEAVSIYYWCEQHPAFKEKDGEPAD